MFAELWAAGRNRDRVASLTTAARRRRQGAAFRRLGANRTSPKAPDGSAGQERTSNNTVHHGSRIAISVVAAFDARPGTPADVLSTIGGLSTTMVPTAAPSGRQGQLGVHRREVSADTAVKRSTVRNQQVSGSSPLAGSNRINNLQGLTGSAIAAVSALCRQMLRSSPQEPAPRGNIVNARDDATVEPPWRALPPFRPGLAVTHLLIGPRPRRAPSAAIRLSPGTSRNQSALSLRRHPRLRGQRCETPFSRSGCVQHSVTNHPTAGLPVPDNPPRVSVRHRRSLPATPGRERLAPLSGQPQPVAGRLRLVDQWPVGRRQPQLPPRGTAREARPPRRLPPLLQVHDDVQAVVRPNRASGARGSGAQFSIVAVVSPSVSRPDEALDR